MRTIFIYFFAILLPVFTGRAAEPVTFIGRIEHKGTDLKITRSFEGDSIPGMLESKDLLESVARLGTGDEVVIKGFLTFRTHSLEGQTQTRPLFVVNSIKPISLSEIGKIESTPLTENYALLLREKDFSPVGIPVSTEIASAITLTTSLLLLQSLTSRPTDVATTTQLNSGLLIFAGAMATGVFIFDQIMNSQHKGNEND